ncbi:MAG: glycosyltransferase family 4 protein [Planctomycetaceae bacterium]|jgi:glycosyltransferase involved in cell wall biosynthesis|nr:glycosyltransferase family 4 protein [Planctomycetaceae bacterium]
MKLTRILYLVDDIYSSRGGTEQHLLWLLRNIPDAEFEKHFIIFSTVHHPETFTPNIEPLVLGRKFGFGIWSWLRRFYFLLRYIREHEIELIQAFSANGELAAVLAARLSGRGTVVIGNRRDCGYDRRFTYRWIFWLTKKFGTKYMANSEAARQAAFHNDKIPLESITVIRNPIAFDRIQTGLSEPLRRDELPFNTVDRGGKIVGMVATVRPIKDYTTLIRAAKVVLEKFPDTLFLFVGESDAAHKNELIKIANQENVAEQIIWLGGIDNPIKIVKLFDVAVLSSHSESFSNSVLEYAAAARPIVISDVGGLGEIINDGESGFVVPPENPTAMAEKIIQLLNNNELAQNLGKNAKELTFQNYNEQKILKQYINYYIACKTPN